MNSKYIIVILGEPYSTFSEIIGKYFKRKKKHKRKIILVGNINLLKKQLKKLKHSFPINQIKNLNQVKSNVVNMIDVKFNYKLSFDKISSKSSRYIEECFYKSLNLIKNKSNNFIIINGPISKKSFLKKKYLGITEYLATKTKSKNEVMLIYNKNLSVVPLTTHIPIKLVANNISKKRIFNAVFKISKFYREVLNKEAKIAVLGLNPHCETTLNFSEEEKIIVPSLKFLKKKGINIQGPFSADTFFLDKNIKKYNLVIGMYHDQVLTPIKTLYNFEAINITVGLPFIRISPDHGPNSEMVGKNTSDPSSFFYAMKFAEKIS